MKKILEKIQNGKKITKATFKSFIKRNSDRLFIKISSKFDGNSDMVESIDDDYSKVDSTKINFTNKNDLGITGLWLVGFSRDYFTFVREGDFMGISVYNCCGSSTVSIKMLESC